MGIFKGKDSLSQLPRAVTKGNLRMGNSMAKESTFIQMARY